MGVKLVSASAGSVEIVAPATASNYTATMPAGTGNVVVNGINSSIVSGTSQASTSGTSIDFTSIPSWVKRITVMFSGVSTNGSSSTRIQIGTSGGVETTGYSSASSFAGSTNSASNINDTSGFAVDGYGNATRTRFGSFVITLLGSNAWTAQGVVASDTTIGTWNSAGGKTLSGTLDRVRITTANGTDTFDAGSINILYE